MKNDQYLTKKFEICHIVARSQNNVIGKDGKIPWYSSEDIKFFRQMTIGHTVIMGRKTADSLGEPLGGRNNIVVTSQVGYKFPSGEKPSVVAREPKHAITAAMAYSLMYNLMSNKIFIIGGETIYRATAPITDTLCVTEIRTHVVDGDTFYSISTDFELTEKRVLSPDATLTVYRRVAPSIQNEKNKRIRITPLISGD